MSDAIERGLATRAFYHGNNDGDRDCAVTTAKDIIADQLRALPEDEWLGVLKSAVMHAHEEIHGWGTAEGLAVFVEGLKYLIGPVETVA